MSTAVTAKDQHPLVMVIGAMSDMGRAVAHHFAAAGAPLLLAARQSERLADDAQDLRLRYNVPVDVVELDVLDLAQHQPVIDGLVRLPDIAVCVVGLLGEQAVSAQDPAAARLVMETNYVAPALLLGHMANRFEARGTGVIVGVSSVAGERGRSSNYVYGSAKAGFTAFLSGLRARLAPAGVQVITVKPGFVATRMTAGMKLPGALTAQPEEVAKAIGKAVARKRDVIYVRPVWWLIMAIIRFLPEALFKKMKA